MVAGLTRERAQSVPGRIFVAATMKPIVPYLRATERPLFSSRLWLKGCPR